MDPIRDNDDAVVVAAWTASCAAGIGLEALAESIRSRKSGLSAEPFTGCGLRISIGQIAADHVGPLPDEFAGYDSRNNRLAWLGLQQDDFLTKLQAVAADFGAERCGVVIGTSTSSIGRTEEAYRALQHDRFTDRYVQPEVHNPHSPAMFVARATGLGGPAMTISTACSSSAKVFASAARWLNCGVADAVLVGGIDSLCLSVLYGFNSLQLLAPDACRPFDRRRCGINIGEAAGYALLTRDSGAPGNARLLGWGESSDAFHMSSPHPDGVGAELAMRAALERAGLPPGEIDYLNLHGTATRQNDATEGAAVVRVFGSDIAASSTKGWTGHTLGAAGILEAVLSIEALRRGLLPGTLNTDEPDPGCGLRPLIENRSADARVAMSNSFGFGGSNCSLIFAVAP